MPKCLALLVGALFITAAHADETGRIVCAPWEVGQERPRVIEIRTCIRIADLDVPKEPQREDDPPEGFWDEIANEISKMFIEMNSRGGIAPVGRKPEKDPE